MRLVDGSLLIGEEGGPADHVVAVRGTGARCALGADGDPRALRLAALGVDIRARSADDAAVWAAALTAAASVQPKKDKTRFASLLSRARPAPPPPAPYGATDSSSGGVA